MTSRTLFLVEDTTQAMWTAVPDCGEGLPYPYPLQRGEPLECDFELSLQPGAPTGWLYARVGVESVGGYVGGQAVTRQLGIRLA